MGKFDWLNKETWTTKAGVTLTPAEMTMEHLANTLAMLERNAERHYMGFCLSYPISCCQGHRAMGRNRLTSRNWLS